MKTVSEEEMKAYIGKFKEFKVIANDIKDNIRLLYVFKDRNPKFPYKYTNKRNYIYISKDDIFRVFGENSLGCLGVTKGKPIDKVDFTELKEMNLKRITNIFNGAYHVFACNDRDEIYCWGSNRYGQLGISYSKENSVEPQKNTFLSGKKIVDISCGDLHSLALTENGVIYAWGDNKFGQTGIDKNKEIVMTPCKVECSEEVSWIKIACGGMHSMALNSNYNVYCWGHNNCGQLGTGNYSNEYVPLKIKLKNGIKFNDISCGQKSSFILCTEGDIYIFGKTYFKHDHFEDNQIVPQKYQLDSKLTEISSHISCTVAVAFTDDNSKRLYEFGKHKNIKIIEPKAEETEFMSLIDYFTLKHEITYKAIRTQLQRDPNPHSKENLDSDYNKEDNKSHTSSSEILKEIHKLKSEQNSIKQNLERLIQKLRSIDE